MKLFEITHNFDWKKAFHATNQDIRERPYLEASDVRTAFNPRDYIMKVLPEYFTSVFFSLGWPRALEWDEMRGVAHILQFNTEYLLDNYHCVLLKNDHREHRYEHLEYFIKDPDERDEYLKFVKPFRARNRSPSYADHPKMKEWSHLPSVATPEQYRKFVENELAIRGVGKIRQYLSKHEPYFEELLVQGRIPIKDGLVVQ